MTATIHYHHKNAADDLTIDHYADDDPSTGVVLLLDSDGHQLVEVASALEPWDGGVR